MFSVTINEAKIINFLVRNWSERNSINEIAKRLSLSPMGAYKILKKLEKQKILNFEKIGQSIYYKINLNEQISRKAAEFILSQNDLNSFSKVCAEDLKKLYGTAECVAIFGSVLSKGIDANDIDVFCVVKKTGYEKVRKEIHEIQKASSKHLQLVVQTFEDLANNIKNRDEVVLEIIRKGAFLYGHDIIVEAISRCQQ